MFYELFEAPTAIRANFFDPKNPLNATDELFQVLEFVGAIETSSWVLNVEMKEMKIIDSGLAYKCITALDGSVFGSN